MDILEGVAQVAEDRIQSAQQGVLGLQQIMQSEQRQQAHDDEQPP